MKINPLTKAMIGLTAVGAAGAAYVLVQKRKHAGMTEAAKSVEVHGYVNSGYEAVREAFAENFCTRREIGAACCVYHKGEKVVDLWGGVRNKATGELWEQNTLAGSIMTNSCAHSSKPKGHDYGRRSARRGTATRVVFRNTGRANLGEEIFARTTAVFPKPFQNLQ